MSTATAIPFPTGRSQFIALRDELRSQHENDDLAAVWNSMRQQERAVVLKAAGIQPKRSIDGIERFTREQTVAIRDAIKRMGRFANGLMDRCQSRPVNPASDLAHQARQALDAGDTEAVKHFLALIEGIA